MDKKNYTHISVEQRIKIEALLKAYDVLNKLSIDAKLVNKKIGGRTLAKQHLEYFGEGDLDLFDRGYPYFDLFHNTLASGSHFCARVSASSWSVAKKLLEDGKNEVIADIKPRVKLQRKYPTFDKWPLPSACSPRFSSS